MKICVAQLRPESGNIASNITKHQRLIELAAAGQADIIIFPELSLTGYEPTLAKDLAMDKNDRRLSVFQELSDEKQITVGIGYPELKGAGICISMVIFQPGKESLVYSKKYIHPDEEPFFTPGENLSILPVFNTNIALAICYELSISAHAEYAFDNNAEVYVASVAKSNQGMKEACKRLSAIARENSAIVLVANSVGYCDNFESAGNTSAWNNMGVLTCQLNNSDEGIIIMDTVTQQVKSITI